MTRAQRLLQRARDIWRRRGTGLKALSFGMIGTVNAAIDTSVFFLMLGFVTNSLIAANVTGWLVAVSCSYAMNSFITFARESGRKLRWRDYAAFVASGTAGVIVNTAVLVFAANHFPVWGAKGCAILASFAVNFSLTHFVVFRPRRMPAQTSDRA